ncbi:MAG: DNA alkylation repair protein [Myxococcaceae bacterium]|nr:DNA alkylation repair protein [Myxococcaceae bacterium]
MARAVGKAKRAGRARSDPVRAALRLHARPDKAEGMRAYLKSSMPCLGVQVPVARKVARELFDEPFESLEALSAHVLLLWNGARYREERFVALNVLRLRPHRRWLTAKAAPLLETLIRSGAWWDLVDELATHVVATALENDPVGMTKVVRRWAASGELWLQRAALVCQVLRHEATDLELLAYAIERAVDGKDFFLRKGIGWAMRAVGRDRPEVVRAWLERWRGRLSRLSVREASKAL